MRTKEDTMGMMKKAKKVMERNRLKGAIRGMMDTLDIYRAELDAQARGLAKLNERVTIAEQTLADRAPK